MPQTLSLDGHRIDGIATFYDEVNRVFMAGEDWALGHSLDAFNDMLYGGYGALADEGPVTLVWTAFARSRQVLGADATRAWLQAKLEPPGRYDTARIQRELDALGAGTGPTFFELVLEILATHPRITLGPR